MGYSTISAKNATKIVPAPNKVLPQWRAQLVRNFAYICSSGGSRPSGGGNPPLRQAPIRCVQSER